VGLLSLALGANGVLGIMGRRPTLYRPWLPTAVAVLDTVLISTVVYVVGAPVLAVTYLLAIVPYAFDGGVRLGVITTLASVTGFLLASWGFAVEHPTAAAPWPTVWLAAGLLLLVAHQLVRLPVTMIARVRRTRARMTQVEQGDLSARADARHADELGDLERSFNRMLDALVSLIHTVQAESAALGDVAHQVTGSANALQKRAHDVAGNAAQLRELLATQRERAAEGLTLSREARHTAELTRRTAEGTATDAHALDDAALASRAAIERAAHSLVRVGSEVTEAVTQVRALAPASEQVGAFVATVSRIARQTNLLALNAAMEASRAGVEGAGFAVVAEEIRTLAAESAAAATQVASTVQRVRDDIDAAVLAMDDTAAQVQGAGTIAREATRALSSMVDGIGRITRQSDEVASLADGQARLASAVADAFESLDASAQQARGTARSTADAAVAQRGSMDAVFASAARLADAVVRLRTAAAHHTGQYPIAEIAPAVTASTMSAEGTVSANTVSANAVGHDRLGSHTPTSSPRRVA
jgi:methyl-accepting chemotaxis protein